MSEVYTDNYAKAFNQSPGKLIPLDDWMGAVRFVIDSYEAVALAASSTILVCKPPKGARLIGGCCRTSPADIRALRAQLPSLSLPTAK